MMVEKIAVVGVGKLGLCFALNLERSGFRVWGIERDRAYVQSLTDRTFRSSEPEVDDLLSKAERLTFTDSLECIVNEQITDVFIMVATPSLPDGSYDHSQLERVMADLVNVVAPKAPSVRHIYIGCTTMPGYCDRLAADMQGTGLSISYNPEFIAQGTIIRDQLYPDQILIGEASQSAGDRLQYIYSRMVRNSPTYCRMDPLSAEIAKLATNCFLTTKISFANSIGDLAIKAGADPHRILAAIGSDSRIGEKYLRYGYGFGGPCFPRDNRALGLFGQQLEYPLHISHATDKVNEEHLRFQVTEILNGRQPNEEIVIDGVAYKPGTDQLTESQSLRLAVALAKAGRQVLIVDSEPVIRSVETMYPGMFRFKVASAPEVK
jgi:nucleotide sugar dehydrogenase